MIFAVKPFEIHDGDGIRTTVFFKGCPLRCRWCHNPESFLAKREVLYDSEACVHCMKCTTLCDANREEGGRHLFDRSACTSCGACEGICPVNALELVGRDSTPAELAEEILRDAMFMKASGGGVTFSGGEPLLQIDYCVELAKLLKREGINLAIDTSAYVSRESLDRIIPYVDTFLFDIKAIDEAVHLRCTGVSNRTILDNIRYVDSLGVSMEIRYPYVPTYNDGEAIEVAKFVGTLRSATGLRLLPYHSYAEHKYKCLDYSYPLSDLPMPKQKELAPLLTQMRTYTKILED